MLIKFIVVSLAILAAAFALKEWVFKPKLTQEQIDGKVQAILNRVIKAGLYEKEGAWDDAYMCISLAEANECRVISWEDCVLAKKEIVKYLKGRSTLAKSLMENNLPYTYPHRKKIYQNWANRPKLLSTEELINARKSS